jgi:CDP-6-deoxy-D-xylo-4-hexulose-3-dehydrase
VYSHLGYNLKMTDLQASVGVAQLARLDAFAAARRRNWAFFRETLADLQDALELPQATPGSDPSWFGFLVAVRPGAPVTRDDLVRKLEERKIQTRMLFAGNLVRQPALTVLAEQARAAGTRAPFRAAGPLEGTDAVMNRSMWVGVYPGLTEPMREWVARSFREIIRR